MAGLVPVDGVLYGTTLAGGGGRCTYGQFYVGCGTVFKITTSGVETVVHSFAGGSDGNNPEAGLIDVDGTLYGTTDIGGGTGCITAYSIGCGTVFKVTSDGKERIVHNFTGPPADGKYPYAGLLEVDGTLYGTTSGGGRGCAGPGCGTVFSIEL